MCQKFFKFLALNRETNYYEQDIGSALITYLQDYLLELNNGFLLVTKQKWILIKKDKFFVDLVFYNQLLYCFVVIEIKTHKLIHKNPEPLQMHMNYYDMFEKLPEENQTFGILLCAANSALFAKISLSEDSSNILTSKYKPYLPSEKTLIEEIKKIIDLTDGKHK
jgi:hypothetical protein